LTRAPIDEPSDIADVADLDALLPPFAGVDSVVHLAAAASPTSTWEQVLSANIIGARNVFEAARQTSVAQVVFASSTHAVGMYDVEGGPKLFRPTDGRQYDEHVDLRPDSLYGLSKAFGELCGRLYVEQHGVRVICLRIGYVARHDPPRFPDNPHGDRMRAIWLSHRDCARLFAAAVDADDVDWAVAYGTSDNARQVWDLSSARELLGYRPQDRAS
jgi:nucleoside-diphosphate-sugar epimerase